MRIALIRGLVACLPETNRALLRRLCLFFAELATHSEVTRMHCENLATVFGMPPSHSLLLIHSLFMKPSIRSDRFFVQCA